MGVLDNIDAAIEQDIKREEAEAKKRPVDALETEKPKAKSKRLVKKFTAFSKAAQRKRKAEDNDVVPGRGILYLGHIPDGFHEKEMSEYFCQFGRVFRIKLSRSRKTGGSRGYAFIEFESKEVAEVVAESMNGYRMFKKTLQAKVVPEDQVHPKIWYGRNIPKEGYLVSRRAHFANKMKQLVKPSAARLESEAAKERQLNQKLAEMGIDYSFVKLTSEDGPSKIDAMKEAAKKQFLLRQLKAEKKLEDATATGAEEKKAVSAKKRKQEMKEEWFAKTGETAEEKAARKAGEKLAKKEFFKEKAVDSWAAEKASKASQKKEMENAEAARNKLAVLEAVVEAKEQSASATKKDAKKKTKADAKKSTKKTTKATKKSKPVA